MWLSLTCMQWDIWPGFDIACMFGNLQQFYAIDKYSGVCTCTEVVKADFATHKKYLMSKTVSGYVNANPDIDKMSHFHKSYILLLQ